MRLLRKYRGFRGIDLRQGAVPLTHSPDCLNLWKDYRLPGSIRTRPSMQEDSPWDGGVQGIYFLENQLLIHTGFQMYARGSDGQWREVYDVREMGYLESGDRTASFLRDRDGDQELYILTGRKYIKYDGNAFPVEGYIPTTSIARAPAGGGQTYEPVNLLTPERLLA